MEAKTADGDVSGANTNPYAVNYESVIAEGVKKGMPRWRLRTLVVEAGHKFDTALPVDR